MNTAHLLQCTGLVPDSYVAQAQQSMASRSKLVSQLLEKVSEYSFDFKCIFSEFSLYFKVHACLLVFLCARDYHANHFIFL